MAAANYENCLAITLKWEGGDVNHPADPGGKTRWGITQATYNAWRKAKKLPTRSVFEMTRDEMLAIYKANYWDAVKGDTLAWGVDLATWDFGVNSGPARARKALLSVIGGTDKQTVQRLCAKRMSFVQGLKTWKVFGKGWANRIADIEARGVKMAVEHSGEKTPQQVKAELIEEAAAADRKAATQKDTATGAGGGVVTSGGAGAALEPDFWASVALGSVFVVCVVLLVYAIIKSRQNKTRADAYAAVASET